MAMFATFSFIVSSRWCAVHVHYWVLWSRL